MLDYRLYALTPTGRIVNSPVEFTSASDEEAVAHAQQFRDGSHMELWQLGRLVTKFPPLGYWPESWSWVGVERADAHPRSAPPAEDEPGAPKTHERQRTPYPRG